MKGQRYAVHDVDGVLEIREAPEGESYAAARERMLKVIADRLATLAGDMRRLLICTTFEKYEEKY